MIFAKSRELGPGEARARIRQRRYIIFMAICAVVGAVVGFLTGRFDQGDGNLFAGDWDKLSLDPAVAILIAVLVTFAFVALPLFGFRQIDEFKREHNFIGFTGGCLAVLAGFPAWAALHAGKLAPAPHAAGIWAIAFVAMIASFLVARWRLS
jgi:hypothetical protein